MGIFDVELTNDFKTQSESTGSERSLSSRLYHECCVGFSCKDQFCFYFLVCIGHAYLTPLCMQPLVSGTVNRLTP